MVGLVVGRGNTNGLVFALDAGGTLHEYDGDTLIPTARKFGHMQLDQLVSGEKTRQYSPITMYIAKDGDRLVAGSELHNPVLVDISFETTSGRSLSIPGTSQCSPGWRNNELILPMGGQIQSWHYDPDVYQWLIANDGTFQQGWWGASEFQHLETDCDSRQRKLAGYPGDLNVRAAHMRDLLRT